MDSLKYNSDLNLFFHCFLFHYRNLILLRAFLPFKNYFFFSSHDSVSQCLPSLCQGSASLWELETCAYPKSDARSNFPQGQCPHPKTSDFYTSFFPKPDPWKRNVKEIVVQPQKEKYWNLCIHLPTQLHIQGRSLYTSQYPTIFNSCRFISSFGG